MNENIKLLIMKAGGIICSDMATGTIEKIDYLRFDAEKFAELIVRECRDIVEQDMKLAHIQMIPLTLEKYANGRLKEKIREHFGVE